MADKDAPTAMDDSLESESSVSQTLGVTEKEADLPSNISTSQFNTFTEFSLLPLEMRLRIWRYLEPEPATSLIEILCKLKEDKTIVYADTPTVATLSVCNESRQEAQQRYKLLFRESNIQRTYIRPSSDICLIGENLCNGGRGNLCTMSDLIKGVNKITVWEMKHVAINFDSLYAWHTLKIKECLENLLKFNNLERLTVLIEGYPHDKTTGEEIEEPVTSNNNILVYFGEIDDILHVEFSPDSRTQAIKSFHKLMNKASTEIHQATGWKKPEIDFKVLMGDSVVLGDLDVYTLQDWEAVDDVVEPYFARITSQYQ